MLDKESKASTKTMRQRYRVLSADVVEQHQGEKVWCVRLRPAESAVPRYTYQVATAEQQDLGWGIGAIVEIDERLLSRE